MKQLIFIIAICLLLSSCSLFDSKGEVIAQVGDEKLTLEELKVNFSDSEWKAMTPDQKKEYVQQWVNLVLLAEEAEKQGMEKDKTVQNKIEYAEMKILGNALIASRLQAEQISEEEMFNYYRIHQGDFATPMVNYKAQRIYLTDINMVNRVKADITAGMKFDDAARVYSQDNLASNGGFMGTVTPDGPDSTFWLALKNTKLYDMTVLQQGNGYFILRAISEESGTGETGFEGQKEAIRRLILEERRKQVYDDLINELKSKSEIYLMI
jgi:peptidyl-prolyl cis-trans isomerase C